MKKACIFDLDGTVADTLGSIVFYANSALRECGYREIPAGRYRYLVGNGADRLMRGMLGEASPGFSEEDVRALRAVYDRLYESGPMYLVKHYPGLPEALAALRAAGVRLAVLSNKPDNVACSVASQLYPEGTFAVCHGQRAGIPRKPAPDGALLLAEELGVLPGDCLYIGDTDVDMETGRAAGMETVGVLWGFRDRAELEAHRAAHIISSPEELLPLALG